MMEAKRLQVGPFIVGLAVFPTPEQDADPFESQSAYGGMMAFAFVDLRSIVGTRPGGFSNRMGRELMEGLA